MTTPLASPLDVATPRDGVVRGACPHDCPDTCAMLVTVENGRAVRIAGDPRASLHAGVPLREGESLPRAHLSRGAPRALRCGASGQRAAASSRRSRGRARSTEIARATGRDRGIERRAAGDPAVLVRRHDGSAAGLVDGSPVLPSARRIAARPHDLLDGRHGGDAHDGGREHRRRRRGNPRERPRAAVGDEHAHGEPAPLAVRAAARASAARASSCIDPIRTRTAAQCDEWIPIRPGTDAALALGMMHVLFARWPGGPRLPRAVHARHDAAARARARSGRRSARRR